VEATQERSREGSSHHGTRERGEGSPPRQRDATMQVHQGMHMQLVCKAKRSAFAVSAGCTADWTRRQEVSTRQTGAITALGQAGRQAAALGTKGGLRACSISGP
jgi:hypothetical protein